MSSRVVYTSVFGGYDKLVEQNLPNGWDFAPHRQGAHDSALPGRVQPSHRTGQGAKNTEKIDPRGIRSKHLQN